MKILWYTAVRKNLPWDRRTENNNNKKKRNEITISSRASRTRERLCWQRARQPLGQTLLSVHFHHQKYKKSSGVKEKKSAHTPAIHRDKLPVHSGNESR